MGLLRVMPMVIRKQKRKRMERLRPMVIQKQRQKLMEKLKAKY
jgi:hypothetical protein